MTDPGLPSPSGHLLLVDDQPGPEGWRATCIPHGPLGACALRVDAFRLALEHDEAHGGDTGT